MRQRKGMERSKEGEKAGPCGRGGGFLKRLCHSGCWERQKEKRRSRSDTLQLRQPRGIVFSSSYVDPEDRSWSKRSAHLIQRPGRKRGFTGGGDRTCSRLNGANAGTGSALVYCGCHVEKYLGLAGEFCSIQDFFFFLLIGLSFGGETGNPFAY